MSLQPGSSAKRWVPPRTLRGGRGRFIEPGGSAPFLVTVLVGLIVIVMWRSRPWENNWEAIRVAFSGEERTQSVAGNWEISKVVLTGTKPKGMLVPNDATNASLAFTSGGGVTAKINRRGREIVAKGTYGLKGTRLTLLGFDANIGNYTAGSHLAVRVIWTDPENLMMKVGNEQVLYLRKADPARPPAHIVMLDALAGGTGGL
jgi:hypothetical protein